MDLLRIGDGAKRTWPDDEVGSKAANLAHMAALGLPVPPAFVVPITICADITRMVACSCVKVGKFAKFDVHQGLMTV
jgi:phosphoenolpyruvate synthase/pyruvate phosphate dikinase